MLYGVFGNQLLSMVRRVLPRSVENKQLIDRLFVEYRDGFYVYVSVGCLRLV